MYAPQVLKCRYVKESKVLVKIAGYADATNARSIDEVTPTATNGQPQSDGMMLRIVHHIDSTKN